MTSRTGLRRATRSSLPPGLGTSARLLGRVHRVPERDPVPVVAAKRALVLLGQRVAVALAVGGAHEGRDDLEVPVVHLAGLRPEIGEAHVDVQLEKLDPSGALAHGENDRTGVGRQGYAPAMGAIRFGPARVPSRESPEEAVAILLERGFTANEIDFEGGFWMKPEWEWAARFGEAARDADIVLSVHAPIPAFPGHVTGDEGKRKR